MKPLSPSSFDRVVAKPERLWGAPAIARALGVSSDTVRRWSQDEGIPIYCPRPRTYFAYRSELEAWLRTKTA